ncbi:hypothetical protein NEDG_00978 [Nematocida displodere]|uniref:Uncharacterized protein n=1 Tax=Nematocida displodere TaxID=1805483 RepID=A0A177ECW7_9MICR|nr:hypothetical protein NEDG_00978 [Nematocida displodere]
MVDYVILTSKGPVVLHENRRKKGWERWNKALFAGAEYTLSFQYERELLSGSTEKEENIQRLMALAIESIQAQKYGRAQSKKVNVLELQILTSTGEAPEEASVSVVAKKKSLANIIVSGIADLFRKKILGTIRKDKVETYVEGDFSGVERLNRKNSPIDALVAYRIEKDEDEHDPEYQVVFEEAHAGKSERVPEKSSRAEEQGRETSQVTSEEQVYQVLKHFQHHFYVGEFKFIMTLVHSKKCIEEIGAWIYNKDYREIFANLECIINRFITLFVNMAGSTLPVAVETNEYISATTLARSAQSGSTSKARNTTNSPNSPTTLEQMVDLLKAIESEQKAEVTMKNVTLPYIAYLEEVSAIIYSADFVEYIKTVEETISHYKRVSKPEMTAIEQKNRCTVAFLLVDIYHRVIKYRMYTEEAEKLLRRPSHGSTTFQDQIRTLHKHSVKMGELLDATERYKKMVKLIQTGAKLPDVVGDFVDMFELPQGSVIITKDTLILMYSDATRAVIPKKEIWGCSPVPNEDAATEHIDICVSSIYPPSLEFVVDCVNDMRVHWFRLSFKSEEYVARFLKAFRCESVPKTPGLCLSLTPDTIPVEREGRDRLHHTDVQKSHRRMLAILEQRKLVASSDIYTYGRKNKLPDSFLFALKKWVDSSLSDISKVTKEKRASVETYALKTTLLKEVNRIIRDHPPKFPYANKNNEFSNLPEKKLLSHAMPMYLDYLSYTLRVLETEEMHQYSASILKLLGCSVGMKDSAIPCSEFLELALGGEVSVPKSLTRNEFFLSLLVIRYFVIITPYIGAKKFMSILLPLFIYHSKELGVLLENTSSAFQVPE